MSEWAERNLQINHMCPQDSTPPRVPTRQPLQLAGVDHASHLRRILSGLDVPVPRDDDPVDDLTLGLADAVASVCDVLGFYQERLINEAFLSTAVEPRSVIELARLVGYARQQGTAAQGHLAYTIEPSLEQEVRINAGSKIAAVPRSGELPQVFETSRDLVARAGFNELKIIIGVAQLIKLEETEIKLERPDLGLAPGCLVVLMPRVDLHLFFVARAVTSNHTDEHTVVKMAPAQHGDTAQTTAGGDRTVVAFRRRASLFGHNAPKQPPEKPGGVARDWPIDEDESRTPNRIDLEGHYPTLLPGDKICIEIRDRSRHGEDLEVYTIDRTELMSRSGYGITGNVTRLHLDRDWKSTDSWGEGLAEVVQRPTVHIDAVETQSSLVPPAVLPADLGWVELHDSYPGLRAGRHIIVDDLPPADRPADWEGRPEVLRIAQVWQPGSDLPVPVGSGRRTAITLDRSLRFSHDPTALKIYANVVEVTHGETYEEVLGSGDATAEHQSFPLSRKPLTRLSSLETGRAAPAITVQVGGEAWTPVGSLAEDRTGAPVFLVEEDNKNAVEVTFGDGRHGARPPTGRENILARYRVGSGVAGNVGPGRLRLPIDHPLGVQQAVNPAATVGGTEAEPIARVRANAAFATLSLGHVVSAADCEALAQSMPGIAKALLAPVQQDADAWPLLSVLGDLGAGPLEQGDPRWDGLVQALRAAAPWRPPMLCSGAVVPLSVSVRVKPVPGADWATVVAEVELALTTLFGFENRQLGQAARMSEALSAVHSVPGVAYGEFTRFGPHALPSPAKLIRQVVAAAQGGISTLGRILPATIVILRPEIRGTLVIDEWEAA